MKIIPFILGIILGIYIFVGFMFGILSEMRDDDVPHNNKVIIAMWSVIAVIIGVVVWLI